MIATTYADPVWFPTAPSNLKDDDRIIDDLANAEAKELGIDTGMPRYGRDGAGNTKVFGWWGGFETCLECTPHAEVNEYDEKPTGCVHCGAKS